MHSFALLDLNLFFGGDGLFVVGGGLVVLVVALFIENEVQM